MPESPRKARKPRRRTPRRTYHHGDLRQALLDAACEILRTKGVEALTLRAVARAAGVSQTAPYRHFADRRSLVAGVAQESFARMGEAIGRAVQSGKPGLPALERGMATYVHFALEHPAEYRVMFGPELANRDDLAQLSSTALEVFGLLRQGIARQQQSGALGKGDPGLMAITAWATLHGLAMLALDEQTAVTGEQLDTLVRSATDLLLAGMGAKRAR